MNTADDLIRDTVLTALPTQKKRTYADIIGDSKPMQKVYSLMDKIVNSGATVLLRGETGTGKEVVAQALHCNSHRRNMPFVVQNCAALPETLLESELFGYKKGAFSGATTNKKGLIELADGGTLFLDEIGDMPMGLQVKLLRILQDKTVRPLGSVDSNGTLVNVRFIAATHCDIKAKINSGEFREDLYYRLCVFPIDLPPLRHRREDIAQLLQHFLATFSNQYEKSVLGFTAEAADILRKYSYPGNIRDLRNIVERSVLMCDSGGYIHPEHLSEEIYQLFKNKRMSRSSKNPNERDTLKEKVEKYEAYLIRKKLSECSGNQTKAASELNIARRTIIDKINRYGIAKNLKCSEFLNQTNEFFQTKH